MLPILYLLLNIVAVSIAEECVPSITTASGSSAPQKICSGQLIFEENFDSLNKEIWKPLSTFSDGGVSQTLNTTINFFYKCYVPQFFNRIKNSNGT